MLTPGADAGSGPVPVTAPLWRDTEHWRWIRLALVIAAAIAIVLTGRELAHHLAVMEHWIAGLGGWALLAFIGIYVVCSVLLIPDSVFGVIAGVVFGLPLGFVAVATATLIGAAAQYPMAHHLLRRPVERFVTSRPTLAAIRAAVGRGPRRLQALIRLTPINRALLSYVLASSGVRFGGYLLACMAHFPSIALEVWAGHAGRHLIHLRSTGRPSLGRDLLIFGGLVVAGLLMTLVSRAARRAVDAATS